jgi:hypothetical protein
VVRNPNQQKGIKLVDKMNFVTPEAQEAFERIDTIHWTFHVAMLSMSRYREILSDEKIFSSLFPNVPFENPKIAHTVEKHGVLFITTKREVLEDRNYDLYKAWQIALAITGMTSILEHYLKTLADKLSGESCNAMGIFHKFKRKTRISPVAFKHYKKLRHFYEVRNITMHNLGRVNQRFENKTEEHHHNNKGPYVFYPTHVTEYRDLIGLFLGFIESHLPQ